MSAVDGELSVLHPRILCVDDEPLVLEGLRAVLRRYFEVRTATSGPAGLALLREDPDAYAIVFSDMRMPVMSGAVFLREARLVAPDAVRILLTGHADLDTAIKVVNDAGLFRFLTKPCDSGELLRACAAAMHRQRAALADRELLEETLRGSVDALSEVLALTSPAAFDRGNRVKTLARELALAMDLPNAWEVEAAAMLAHIGAVILPQATAEKAYAGRELTETEAAMIARVPAVTRRLIARIPRLEGVTDILDCSQVPPHGPRMNAGQLGGEVLRAVTEYDGLTCDGTAKPAALEGLRTCGSYDPQLVDALAWLVGLQDDDPDSLGSLADGGPQ